MKQLNRALIYGRNACRCPSQNMDAMIQMFEWDAENRATSVKKLQQKRRVSISQVNAKLCLV